MQSITHQLPFNEVVFQPLLALYFSRKLKPSGHTLPIPTCKLGMHCEDFPQVGVSSARSLSCVLRSLPSFRAALQHV